MCVRVDYSNSYDDDNLFVFTFIEIPENYDEFSEVTKAIYRGCLYTQRYTLIVDSSKLYPNENSAQERLQKAREQFLNKEIEGLYLYDFPISEIFDDESIIGIEDERRLEPITEFHRVSFLPNRGDAKKALIEQIRRKIQNGEYHVISR